MTQIESPNGHARLDVSRGVVTVTITRPEKLNAISPEVTDLLWEAARILGDEPASRVLLIAAEGDYFTAGIDLVADGPGSNTTNGHDLRRSYRRHHLLYDELESIEKPVVLAAQGVCLGAGLEMAVSCDFRLAADTASFGLPEINLGVIPGSGGVSRLNRLVGPHWTKWIAMAGRRVGAGDALAMGLVHQVYSSDTFAAEVSEFVSSLIALPPEALGVAKLSIDMVADVDRRTARDIERIANTPLIMGDEHRSSVDAFRRRSSR